MKQKFILVFFIIIFFSCKKDGTPNQQSSKEYYFEATLSDGKTFKLKGAARASDYLFFSNSVADVIGGEVYNNKSCTTPGDCFIWKFLLSVPKEGTYDPYDFSLYVREGADWYQYHSTAPPNTSTKGKVSMTFSKVERGTRDKPGSLEGTFSGTVVRSLDTAPGIETPVQISGKFRLTLEQ
jgi:hypothetical protein